MVAGPCVCKRENFIEAAAAEDARILAFHTSSLFFCVVFLLYTFHPVSLLAWKRRKKLLKNLELSRGMGGALEYVADLLGGGASKSRKKRKQLQTVELKVRMDCDGCERRVKNAVSSIKGVKTVDVNRKMMKVTVVGYVDPSKVLKKVQATGKKAEIWPYVPYNLVAQPYSAQAYDKKAPSGYVRKVEAFTVPNSSAPADPYISLFSDDNPNACSIM